MPILKEFDRKDDRYTETFKTTTGFFDGGLGQLGGNSLTTASLADGQKEYYLNLQYNSKDHISIAYGDYFGSGSDDRVGQTKAVYRQMSNTLLLPNDQDEVGFVFSGSKKVGNRVRDVWFLSFERLQMKDRMNKKNWTLVLTGSNTAGDAGITLHLTDNSEYGTAEATPVGPRWNVISGSAGNKGNNAVSTIFGAFWPHAGIIALDGTQLSASMPGATATTGKAGFGALNRATDGSGTENVLKLLDCMSTGGGASRSTNITHQFRAEEDVTTNSYFCRAKATEFNFSNNPTYSSGSDNTFTQPSFITNPTTFITEVGLYDGSSDLIAIAKLSTPIQKDFANEAVIKVNLTY